MMSVSRWALVSIEAKKEEWKPIHMSSRYEARAMIRDAVPKERVLRLKMNRLLVES
jgi:hypothetical protein